MTYAQLEIVLFFCQRARIPLTLPAPQEQQVLDRVGDAIVDTLIHFGWKRIAKAFLRVAS